MKKQRNICDYIVRLFVGIMMFFFVYILLSFVMINICYERLGINNPIINHFLGDTTTNASSDTDILDINWQEQYPFSDDIIFQKGIKPQEVAEIYLTQKYIKPIMVIKIK